ncbi:transposase [Allopusillimonas ginsengisoli]|nr:transposase [Allopusillimonas ginsengisoli]
MLHRRAAENLSYRELAAIYNIGNPHSITMWQQQHERGGRVLKKSQCLGSREEICAAERTQIVLELRHEFPLADLLHVAQLPRSMFYYQAKVLLLPGRYDELKAKIQAVHAEHRGLYGYRRITATIRRDGRQVNHKTVQRLMNKMGMKSRVRVKKTGLIRASSVRQLLTLSTASSLHRKRTRSGLRT